LLKDLEEVCALSEQYGLKGEVSVGEVRKLIEKFKDARAKEVSEQVEAIVTGEDVAARMTAIAKLDIQTHALLVEFSETCSKFLHERAGKAQGKILTWTTEVVETKKSEVDRILTELEDAVTPFAKGNE
jgi:ABC-type transporter Mla MlaB component